MMRLRRVQRRHATIILKQHCRNYFYGCKDTSIQNKYHEDQTYIKDIEHIRMVIKDITEKLKQQHDHNNNNNKSNNKLPLDWESYFNEKLKLRDGLMELNINTATFRHLTHLFTYPLTLTWIIQYLDSTGYLKHKNKDDDTLKIACVGSRAEGQIPYLLWEECVNMIEYKKLHIHFVGPMQLSHQHQEIQYKDTLKLTYETGVYSPPPLQKKKEDEELGDHQSMMPDIFLAYNSGNSDTKWQHVWRPTLIKASELNIPLIFTSYDGIDLASDFGHTMNFWGENNNNNNMKETLETIIHPTANPFLNMMPGIYDELPNRVIHSNQFIYGVRRIK